MSQRERIEEMSEVEREGPSLCDTPNVDMECLRKGRRKFKERIWRERGNSCHAIAQHVDNGSISKEREEEREGEREREREKRG